MRPMTQAETAKVHAILASSPPATDEALRHLHYGREALVGSAQQAQMMEDFLQLHREISVDDLDTFCGHLHRCFPRREITAQICPDDDSGGILIFSIYGFSERDQVNSAEEDRFHDDFPTHLDYVIGAVTIFPRTGPYIGRHREKDPRTDGGDV